MISAYRASNFGVRVPRGPDRVPWGPLGDPAHSNGESIKWKGPQGTQETRSIAVMKLIEWMIYRDLAQNRKDPQDCNWAKIVGFRLFPLAVSRVPRGPDRVPWGPSMVFLKIFDMFFTITRRCVFGRVKVQKPRYQRQSQLCFPFLKISSSLLKRKLFCLILLPCNRSYERYWYNSTSPRNQIFVNSTSPEIRLAQIGLSELKSNRCVVRS